MESDSAGYWFCFTRSKQRNKLEETSICVPRRQKDWLPCSNDSGRKPVDYDPASVIDSYFEAVMQDLDCKREELKGGFFKGTHGKLGKRFIRANIGKNTLALVGIEIASELCLRAPESFTGHCWRRSAGTNASNAGVNVTTLMSMMGWSCPKTAMQYVKRSRITSLKMSMYLANVQRRNLSDPFPVGGGRGSRKVKFRNEETVLAQLNSRCLPLPSTIKTLESSNVIDSESCDIEKFESEICTQDLLCDNLEGDDQSVVISSQSLLSDTVSCSVTVPSVSNFSPIVSCAPVLPVSNVVASVVAPINSTSSLDLSTIDSRLVNVLQNLQNHGTIQIHFNFGDAKK